MEEQVREGGVSFGEICSMIWKRIVWILAISAIVAIIAGIFAKLTAPSSVEYNITFMIDYPDSEQQIYPDGTTFRYQTIVYAENLNAVRDSNDEFKGVDTEGMASSRSIGIAEKSRTIGEETIEDLKIFTITIDGSYFKNAAQATKFLHALCDYTIETIIAKVEEKNFFANLANYETVSTFDGRINSLKNQQKYLLDQYDKYSEIYGNFRYGEKTLDTHRAEVFGVFDGKEVGILTTIRSYEIEYASNDAMLKALRAERDECLNAAVSSGGNIDLALSAFNEKIASYAERNALIHAEIAKLYTSIGYVQSGAEWVKPEDPEESDETVFEEDIAQLYEVIKTQTETCKNVITALYRADSAFIFEQNDAVVVGGGASSVWKYAIIGFVAAFVIASAVFCVIDYNRKKKGIVETEEADATGSEGEQKAETPVAESNPEVELTAAEAEQPVQTDLPADEPQAEEEKKEEKPARTKKLKKQ